jgi:hypothetical protein
MQEVQVNDLKLNKMYYIESEIAISPGSKRRRQKGIFKRVIVETKNDDYMQFVHFEGVENINKNDETGPGITGTNIYPKIYDRNKPQPYNPFFIPGKMYYYTKYTKFYECKKEEIIERKEKETLNMVLQQILGDSKFNFY